MPQYDWPELNLAPDEFTESTDPDDHYSIPGDDGDEHDIQQGFDELENLPDGGYQTWKKIISQINKPDALKLQGHYLLV